MHGEPENLTGYPTGLGSKNTLDSGDVRTEITQRCQKVTSPDNVSTHDCLQGHRDTKVRPMKNGENTPLFG